MLCALCEASLSHVCRRAAIAPAIQEVNASTCSLAPAQYKGHVISLEIHKMSAEACWKACRSESSFHAHKAQTSLVLLLSFSL